MQGLTKTYESLVTGLHILGSGVVFILMLIIVGDVVGRAFFNHPITGAPELARVSLVSVLFLGLAKTLRMGKHIRATLLLNRASPVVAAGLDLLANLLGLFVFVLLCYSCWGLTVEAWAVGEFEGAGALRVPTYPLRTLILVCSFLTMIQFAVNVFEAVRLLGREAGLDKWIRS
ncbi:MAG: TRAP transporter small permease [Deltaproteobacteria bacterium]